MHVRSPLVYLLTALRLPADMKTMQRLGHLGTGLSFVCLVHCLAFPILVTVLPLVGLSFLLTGTAEKVILSFACVMTGASLLLGFRIHRSIRPFLILLSAIAYYWLAIHDSRQHILCLLLGGASLLYATLENRAQSRGCATVASHDHDEGCMHDYDAVLAAARGSSGE